MTSVARIGAVTVRVAVLAGEGVGVVPAYLGMVKISVLPVSRRVASDAIVAVMIGGRLMARDAVGAGMVEAKLLPAAHIVAALAIAYLRYLDIVRILMALDASRLRGGVILVLVTLVAA